MSPFQVRALISSIRKMREDNTPPDAIIDSVLERLREFRPSAAHPTTVSPRLADLATKCVQEAARLTGEAAHLIKSNCRHKEVTLARHAVIHALRHLAPNATLMRLGAAMNRDHSSILHALNKDCEEVGGLAQKIVDAVK